MISILRIGHRIFRDKRITTHVALVARALGAEKIFIDQKDTKIEANIKSICYRFGGNFQIITGVDRKKLLKNWKGSIVHLTMYGENLEKGFEFFKRHFFEATGRPKYYHNRSYPIDSQCASQAIDTLANFADVDEEALKMSEKVGLWTIQNMQDTFLAMQAEVNVVQSNLEELQNSLSGFQEDIIALETNITSLADAVEENQAANQQQNSAC